MQQVQFQYRNLLSPYQYLCLDLKQEEAWIIFNEPYHYVAGNHSKVEMLAL